MPPAKRATARKTTAAGEEQYQQVIVRMPVEMHAAVKRCAEEEDRTMSHTIRRAVRQYLQGVPA